MDTERKMTVVKAWIANIAPLYKEEVYNVYYERLPKWRKEKAERLKIAADRARSVGAWSLWEKIRETQEVSPDAVYNLSHSGDYVMCAYSDSPKVLVGCDLETTKELREGVARRFFCPSEYEHLMGIKDVEERRQMFYRYWVLKESFMKAVREGMRLDTRTFEIGWNLKGEPVLMRKPEKYEDAYYYQEYWRAEVPARMAVCTTDAEIDPVLHVFREWEI